VPRTALTTRRQPEGQGRSDRPHHRRDRRTDQTGGELFPDGERQTHHLFLFDLKDTSQLPSIAEPLYNELDAQVDLLPVMNQEELKKGLEAAFKR
jgi:hypothetical protein